MLNKPWFHFVLIGLALFWVGQWVFPAPKPVLGPPSPERLAALADNYTRFSGTTIGAEQRERFIDSELRDELLFREGVARELHIGDIAVEQRIIRNMRFLDSQTEASDRELVAQGYALKLHLTDEVIRRRMVQIMERLIVAVTPLPGPDAESVEARYRRDLTQWEEPARYSFSHVFLPLERRMEMPLIIDQIQREQLDATAARKLGGPFLSGYEFRRQSADQMARVFGANFTAQLTAYDAVEASWVGPIESVFGLHYVWIAEIVPSRLQAVEEVSSRIVNDLIREQETQAIAEWVEGAMLRYEVRRS